jgi:hypothetical protein
MNTLFLVYLAAAILVIYSTAFMHCPLRVCPTTYMKHMATNDNNKMVVENASMLFPIPPTGYSFLYDKMHDDEELWDIDEDEMNDGEVAWDFYDDEKDDEHDDESENNKNVTKKYLDFDFDIVPISMTPLRYIYINEEI